MVKFGICSYSSLYPRLTLRGVSRSSQDHKRVDARLRRAMGRDAVDVAACGAPGERRANMAAAPSVPVMIALRSVDDPRCAMRAGAEIRSTGIAFARRPKSCGADALAGVEGRERFAFRRCAPDPDGDKVIHRRGEHEASRKTIASRSHACADFVNSSAIRRTSRRSRGDELVCPNSFAAHETADALMRVRRSARPLYRAWGGPHAP